MLNIGLIKNVAGAVQYFGPSGHDYWIEDKDTPAFFGGKLAEQLGLKDFDIDQLHALLQGEHPTTGEPLTRGLRFEVGAPGSSCSGMANSACRLRFAARARHLAEQYFAWLR